MNEYKLIIERYCPVAERNVPIEITYHKTGTKYESCLLRNQCKQNHGICKNFRQEN